MPIDLPGYLCDPTGARADLPLDEGTAWNPRGVLRGERPKRVLVSFARARETPSGERPHRTGKCTEEKKNVEAATMICSLYERQ